jgi:hypothetical protein
MFNVYIFLIVLTILQISLDLNSTATKKCTCDHFNPKLLTIFLSHHIFNIFANFGWLVPNKQILFIYVIMIPILFMHWQTNDDKCILTQLYNKECGFNDSYVFNDFFSMVGLKKYDLWYDYGYRLYLIMGFCIALYKLYFM